jgi:amidophosphoribosyltransferase
MNLGYEHVKDLGPGEIVYITADSYKVLKEPNKEMKMCSFMWVYYGYPTSTYEGQNVELMRNRCGELLAKRDLVDVDIVAGVPDSGIAHAIGYANERSLVFARPFIKYTPTWARSFMPQNQKERQLIAGKKLIPVKELIKDKLNDDELNRLINDLERNNYINDYNYIKRIFNESESKLKGKLYIESKLKGKELDENIIKAFFEHYNEEELANKLSNREYKKLENKHPKNTIINKISYKLNYNGFSEYVINDVISSLEHIKRSDNTLLIEKDYLKLVKKYQNKYKDKELERKVIESLLLKGYNYKSVKEYIGGIPHD